ADIFFLLSGFFFVRSYAKTSDKDFRPITQRLLRMAPLYLVCLLLFGGIAPLLLTGVLTEVFWIENPLWNMLFIANIKYLLLGGFPREPLTIDWFIACLMQMF